MGMKKPGRKYAATHVNVSVVAALALAVALIFNLAAPAAYADAPKVDAKAYILVNADSGEIYFDKNVTQPLVPASMTKLMTLYLTLESVNEHKISWTDKVTISDYSNKISRQPSLSSFQLPSGAKYTVKELFYATALNSSNAGAIALAEFIGGTEGAFVDMMNAKARVFGLTDVVYVNSSGLNNADLFGLHPVGTGAHDDTKMSARSMATIAFRLVNDYPEYLGYSSLRQMIIREGEADQLIINSTNKLLPGSTYSVDGVKGLKTGYTYNAGFCFAGYAERGAGRFISIVMGASTSEERFRGSGRLLNYGFDLAAGRENRLPDQPHAYLYPDGLNYFDKFRNGSKSLLTLGDTGFGKMDNGKADVLAINGNLYCISKRGHVSRLDDPSGVGSAAMTFFSRDGEIEISGEKGLTELENALLQAVDDTDATSYCFKLEGAVKPKKISTVSSAEAEYDFRGGSGKGVVIGFWNHASENDILRHGFTFYYLDSDRRNGGILTDAQFADMKVRIDRIETPGAIFAQNEEIAITAVAAR